MYLMRFIQSHCQFFCHSLFICLFFITPYLRLILVLILINKKKQIDKEINTYIQSLLTEIQFHGFISSSKDIFRMQIYLKQKTEILLNQISCIIISCLMYEQLQYLQSKKQVFFQYIFQKNALWIPFYLLILKNFRYEKTFLYILTKIRIMASVSNISNINPIKIKPWQFFFN